MNKTGFLWRGKMAHIELSEKNPYYIPKHRYYELKHFCLQYPEWKEALVLLDAWKAKPEDLRTYVVRGNRESDPTEQLGIARAFFSKRVELVEGCLNDISPAIAPYVLKGATESIPYDILRTKGCPCCREGYYEEYRKFFWHLSIERG